MSGASVCVLTPNGRRQTVKCNPNTTILQILEQVCQKQGFKPEEHDLKHHNKILDSTQLFRFSGLPNNAQLELVPASKNRTETEVTLAVNLENGDRLMDKFNPSDTLYQVLTKVCPEVISNDKNPVVIYTRREIYGKELETCSLRSLGLTGGRAMIRVINRDPELLKTQANISAPLPQKTVEEKPYVRKYQPVEKTTEKTEPQSMQVDPPKQPKPTEDIVVKPEKNVKKENVDLIKLAREKRKTQDTPNPRHEEKRKSFSGSDENKCVNKNVDKKAEFMDVDDATNDENSARNYTNKASKSERSIEEDFVFLGDRNAMLFSLESAHALPSEELPDEFFDLTIDEAKKLLRDIRKKQEEIDNAPLKTSALRSLDETTKQLRQMNRYKKAVIRIQFPNRTVLQGTFKPIETISDVMNFVKEYLEDKIQEFYLYSTPPKSVLDPESRLMELGLVPGALIYFGSNKERKEFLRRDLSDKFTTNSVASLAAHKMRQENTRDTSENYNDTMDMDTVETSSTSVNHGASTSTGITHTPISKPVKSTEKVPKWFKPL